VGFGAIGLFVVTVFASFVGAIYQYLGNRRDLQAHPAPGQLFDIGTHRLHLWCVGSGSPVVVLESGGGGNALEWSRVQPEVAKTTRVCSYDRAGFGWSDLGPTPRSARQIVTELHRLLLVAQVPAPYVLAGHSIGGLYIRLHATTHPSEVAGMVLVDATHEDVRTRIPGAAPNTVLLHLVVDLHSAMAAVGWARLMDIRFAGGPALSAEANQLAEGIKFRATAPYADGEESFGWEESAMQVRRTRRVLNIPLVVITRGRWDGLKGLPEDQQQRMKRAWNDMQADLVTLSPQGVQLVATNSDHYVHLGQPAIVVDAIQTVVAKARSQALSSSH
jgi:pimeloyl-ACP methyl ester carboxylesterase